MTVFSKNQELIMNGIINPEKVTKLNSHMQFRSSQIFRERNQVADAMMNYTNELT